MSLKPEQKKFLEALEKNAGNVSETCKKMKVGRTTHYDWIKQSEHYKKEVEDINESLIDMAESQLHKKISKGDTTSIIFFLKSKAKSRGYTEKSELELSGGMDMNIKRTIADFYNLPKEQKEREEDNVDK